MTLLALAACSTAAQAAWIPVADTDLSDLATNPDGPSQPGGTPSDQGTNEPNDIGLWLQDLLNLSAAPALLAYADSFTGSSITGIVAGAQYLTLHYGTFSINGRGFRNATYAYACTSDCGSLTGYNTEGLSNYRIFGTPTSASSVPEPATLGLLGAGLLGLGLSRRRRRA